MVPFNTTINPFSCAPGFTSGFTSGFVPTTGQIPGFVSSIGTQISSIISSLGCWTPSGYVTGFQITPWGCVPMFSSSISSTPTSSFGQFPGVMPTINGKFTTPITGGIPTSSVAPWGWTSPVSSIPTSGWTWGGTPVATSFGSTFGGTPGFAAGYGFGYGLPTGGFSPSIPVSPWGQSCVPTTGFTPGFTPGFVPGLVPGSGVTPSFSGGFSPTTSGHGSMGGCCEPSMTLHREAA